jgi:cysteine desulfurase/selenocysteine lyase
MIYLDNAATSWPKAPKVVKAMANFLKQGCANPGRSAHKMASKANDAVFRTRELLAALFNIADPMRIALMPNATYALNMAIQGFLTRNAQVVSTMMEHNSVLRPLKTLEHAGVIHLRLIKPDRLGRIGIESIKQAVTKSTTLFCMSLSSNVNGAIMPVAEAGKHCRSTNTVFLLDASQGAGVLPIDVEYMCIDMLAFPGHKGLLGPQGTGGLYVREGIHINPIIQGGTGSFSEQTTQPSVFPDVLESGTLNVPGIVGLGEGVSYILKTGIENIYFKKRQLLDRLISATINDDRISVYSPPTEHNSGILALSVRNMDSSEAGYLLNKRYGICIRSGLHCAPLAHRALGTHDKGLIRISPGYFNKKGEIDMAVKALKSLASIRQKQ